MEELLTLVDSNDRHIGWAEKMQVHREGLLHRAFSIFIFDRNGRMLDGKTCVGITAGASAPEVLVQEVIQRLKQCGAQSVRTLPGMDENVTFPLPKGLGQKTARQDVLYVNPRK